MTTLTNPVSNLLPKNFLEGSIKITRHFQLLVNESQLQQNHTTNLVVVVVVVPWRIFTSKSPGWGLYD